VFYTWYGLCVSSGLASRIRQSRKEIGLSQNELARELNLAPRTIQTWELGEAEPRGEHFRRLALKTGKPLAWFWEGEDEQSEEKGEAA
jgi:transcriptional regulator with XRE-family HTH domain